MDRPAILQVLPALDAGGVERGTVEIAEAVVAEGWRALVASEGGRLVAELAAFGAQHAVLPLAAKSPIAIWRNAARLARLARETRACLLHARSRAPAWSARLAARRLALPFVTTWHGTYSEGYPGKRLWNSVMGSGDRVIAISRFIASHMEARGVDPARVSIIPRGVDLRRFDPAKVEPQRVAQMRESWRAGDGPVLLLPGRLTRWKGAPTAILALARLGPSGTLVLAGDAQGRSGFVAELRAVAVQAGVAERVRIVGHVADMPTALLAADIVLHCSTSPEAFGRVVTEGQAMARPVIAADLGGPVETVEEGVTGLRVAPGDPEALAAAIARVLAMGQDERRALGERARARVPTLEAMQRATLDVYRELL